MKSYFKLRALLLVASLIGIFVVAAAFLFIKEQPTAKIPNQAPQIQNQASTEATARAIENPAPPLPESLALPTRRQVGKRPLFSSTTQLPQGVESNTRATAIGQDVAEAISEKHEGNGSPILSGVRDLRTRALKGEHQETAQQAMAPSDVKNVTDRKPTIARLKRAGKSFTGDLRDLPYVKSVEREMPEHEDPFTVRSFVGAPPAEGSQSNSTPSIALPAAPAPTPLNVFEGLDRFGFGAGSPPDTNGDVGPTYYIQTVNTSIGIYNKSTGNRDAAFTFDTFMSQGNFGNLCDTENFGDPVVLYDTFEDRWIITDFAFLVDGGGNALAPAFQCFAASKTADPILGGWNFYSIQLTDFLNDYPKFGIWPDGLYMSANMFGFGAGAFSSARVWAFNKAQMYAGAPSVQSAFFNVGGGDFTVIPSNARLQTGTPPAGTPNYFLSTWLFTNALSIYKFHVDWDRISLTTFTGPDTPIAATAWPNANVANAGQPGTGTLLDVLQIRAMVQNQYTNFGGVESLWAPHTVRRGNTSGLAAPRWYQVTVTGGTVNLSLPQAATWDPDAANVINRFMPSLALDRAGNMALGYSTSNTGATDFPSIKYAGRLSTDPVNTFSLTEQLFFAGTASQTGTTRWGDYSAMTLDPNGCTFWYTTEYANPADQTFDHRWLTKFGSFQFSPCTTIGNGTLQGTVTTSPGGLPISGATVAFGARTTTTNGSGFYSFPAIPAGTYPTETASSPGSNSSTTTNIVVADGGTTVKDFALTSAPASACLVDTTQLDFQLGVPANTDLTASPGDVTLISPNFIDQQNTSVSASGAAFSNTAWFGQTFTPAVTGKAARVDVRLFCSGCTGSPPNVVIAIRNASGDLPTGADLASVSVPFTTSGSSSLFSGNFVSPPTLTSGTQYAIVVRMAAAYATGTPAFVVSSTANPYAGGRIANSTDSGGTWGVGIVSGVNLTNRDLGFRVFMNTGFAASGDLASGVKDSNPLPPSFTRWNSLSWTATVPANTTLQFQIAGSNNPGGPFNFIGPNGTAATFFTTSPANINNLANGSRYLKYKAFFTTTDGAVTPTVNDVTVCYNAGPTAASGLVSGRLSTADGSGLAGVTMSLSGTEGATTITDSNGNYSFANIETNGFYTVTPALANFHFSPANRSFSLVGNKTDAVFTGVPDATVTTNAIDSTEFFVRQQYLDFLDREPDQGGFTYWCDQINQCNGDAACLRTKRLDVSAAFFMSREFQESGSFVYDLYAGALGRTPGYSEFTPDRGQVVGGANLEQARTAFAASFVNRAEFVAKYPQTLAREQFVDALLRTMGQRTGADLSSLRATMLTAYDNGGRAAAVGAGISASAFTQAEYNKAFVLMEYFGYLRRSEDEGGYDFWLNVLNNREPQNYRGMVCAFLTSTEYQRRFSTMVTRGNAECGR